MLLGQAVAAAPHVHTDAVDVEQSSHASRAHIHLHADHCHDDELAHHHEPEAPAKPASDEHNDDAVYLPEIDLTNASLSTSLPELAAMVAVIPSIHDHSALVCVDSIGGHWNVLDDGVRSQCALYAQILSIRC